MKFIPLVLLSLFSCTLLAQDFEQALCSSAATILKPEFTAGVRDTVPTYGGLNAYLLDGGNLLKMPAPQGARVGRCLSGEPYPSDL